MSGFPREMTSSLPTCDSDGLEFARDVLEKESWTPTPLLPGGTIGQRLGIDLWLKREDCTPIGSFKLRGALVTFASRFGQPDGNPRSEGVYVASSGNYGTAIAVAGAKHGIPVTVVVPENAPESKLRHIEGSGANVVRHGHDFDESKDFARSESDRVGATFWEDGVVDEMYWGSGTIGLELLDSVGSWDAVIVPIGNGSLIKGVSNVIKKWSPDTVVIGAVPAGAPSMSKAIRGEYWDESVKVDTIADGLAVRVPIPDIVDDLRGLVDDVLEIEESVILSSIKALMQLEQTMVEPSAAITVGCLVSNRHIFSGKRVAALMTGSHLAWDLIPEVLTSDALL